MKVFSVWQPWATLLVRGFKKIETRGWPAPQYLIGQRLGVAATASVKGPQLRAYREPGFALHYATTGMPELDQLPYGALLGTAVLSQCVSISPEFMASLSPAELSFGWYEEGRWAWVLKEPVALSTPIPVKGRQGLWEIEDAILQSTNLQNADRQEGAANLRGDLHPA